MLLQDKVTLFVLPIILFAAIITRTFVQGFGVLFAIFIGVFVIPTPFVRPVGPLSPGIRDELLFSGMQWLAVTPAKLAALVLLAIGFWLMYWRRRIAAARILMAFTVCVTLLLVLLPMALDSLEFDVRDSDCASARRQPRTRRASPCAIRASAFPPRVAPSSHPTQPSSPRHSAAATGCGTVKSCRMSGRIRSPSSPTSNRADCQPIGA